MVCAREAQPEEEGWWKKLVGGGRVTYNFHVQEAPSSSSSWASSWSSFTATVPRHVNRLTSSSLPPV